MQQQELSSNAAYALELGVTPAHIAQAQMAYLDGQVELSQLAGIGAHELQALYLHAYHTLRQNRPHTAARLFLALTQFDRRQARFYVGLGLAFQHMREFGYAQGCYREALQAEPDDRIALTLYGECAIVLGDKAFASEVFRRVLHLGSRDADEVAYIERARDFLARLVNESRGAAQ